MLGPALARRMDSDLCGHTGQTPELIHFHLQTAFPQQSVGSLALRLNHEISGGIAAFGGAIRSGMRRLRCTVAR
jgi:hypothetical protein